MIDKENWSVHSKKFNKNLFSELDVFLRALDRFFNIENLPIESENLSNRNFHEELLTVRDAILRILGILEVIIPESRKNAFWFQKFAETKYLSSQKRDAFRQSLYSQDTPEKSLYLLYDSFNNFKGVITDLARTRSISYMGFTNIGHLINKEIRENAYFNPFKKSINPDFDIITNHEISQIVKKIENKELKKKLSTIYVYLFRLVRFTGFVDISTQRMVSLNASLIILILLRAEVRVFLAYLKKTLGKIADPELELLLQSVFYQFSMESKRVFNQELKNIHRKKALKNFRGKIENSAGILTNLTEQSIVQLSQYWHPDIKGEDIFESFVTKLEQSLRLREDIYALHKIITLFEINFGSPDKRQKTFVSLKNFMLYFESFTFRFLRHDDYEEFSLFFNEIHAVNEETVRGSDFHNVFERIRQFKIYLETTLRHIAHRAELSGKSIDTQRVESLINQYL
jgi:hypothetical protein